MRKKNFTINPLPSASPYKQDEQSFYNVPDSTASNLVLDVLGAGTDVADLPARKKQINHSTTYEVKKKGNRRLVTMTTQKGDSEVTIELTNIDKLTGSNKPAKKLFVLSLIKANEQAIHNGVLTRDYISFPLKELLDIGFYTTLQSARKGFDNGADALTSLKIKGRVSKSKKKVTDITEEKDSGGTYALEVLFTGATREKGQCFIYLNPRIKWGALTQYFTILPTYYFRLSNRASDLLYYIFYLARQHTGEKDIVEIEDEKTGKKTQAVVFNISFRAIQHRLQLPNEKGAANPQRDIKDAIERAIEELEDNHKTTYDNMEFSLLPVYDDNAPITSFLDNGYLKVSLTGSFATAFIELSKDTARQIAEAEKRKERIIEQAMIKATADKIKEDQDQKDQEGAG